MEFKSIEKIYYQSESDAQMHPVPCSKAEGNYYLRHYHFVLLYLFTYFFVLLFSISILLLLYCHFFLTLPIFFFIFLVFKDLLLGPLEKRTLTRYVRTPFRLPCSLINYYSWVILSFVNEVTSILSNKIYLTEE